MKFEPTFSTTPDFIEHHSKKVEKYGLDLVTTGDELEKLCEGDERCEKALAEMLEYSIRYTNDVWSMKLLLERKDEFDTEQWQEQYSKADRERSQLHNALIDSIKILSRSLLAAERSNDWVKSLAPTGQLERATCGKFAIMLTYWLSVNRSS